ncbi:MULTISPECIES: hypothetical protein [unclassified Pseudomonas]|nr:MULTISPECIES: hypothetical protein [unclassified Pseudomonas]
MSIMPGIDRRPSSPFMIGEEACPARAFILSGDSVNTSLVRLSGAAAGQ